MGAMILFADDYSFISSKAAISTYCFAAIFVLLSGLYVLLNRMHLRFFGVNRGLDEWESGIQAKAYAFSYRAILWAMFTAFVAASVLGVLGLFNAVQWTNISFGQSLQLNTAGISAMIVGLFYLILFLPTLYMAWTLKPLTDD